MEELWPERLSEQEFLEMASVTYKHTGIDHIVLWVGPNLCPDKLRIKVSNVPDCYNGKDCFTLTLPDYSIKGRINQSLITPEIMQEIKKWCKINEPAIAAYSTYKTSTGEFLDSLEKIKR